MAERLAIDRVGHQGDGIAITQTGDVFVPYTLPGETVIVERNGDRAIIRENVSLSPERAAPICEYFGICGGCALQHWQAAGYRAWKRDLIVAALARERVEAPVADLVDAHGMGRRRAVLHARRAGSGVVVGFSARRSHEIIAIERCPVLTAALSRAFTIGAQLTAAMTTKKPLDLHFTATEGGLDVDLRGSGALDAASRAALARIAAAEALVRLTRHGEVVAQFGNPTITIGRARVVLPPGAFLQATEAGENALAAAVCAAANGTDRIADLFCGIGTFALRLAEGRRVLAIDADHTAMAALSQAAKSPGLKPIETASRDLFRRPLTPTELKPFDAVLLDPPRQGAEAQARALAQSAVRRVIYVSCNAPSFARDARILADAGYGLSEVTPVDQFRYSAHVELVGVLNRR